MSPVTQSVALCTYNGSRFLRDQLASIAAQTRIPDELVVCDDGSTDSTAQIVADFARRAPFPVHWHTNATPMGSTKNFEKAISLCDGNIISLSDQDDVWLPDRLHATESAFQSDTAAGAFFSDAEIVDDSLNPLGYRLWDVVRFGRPEQEDIRRGRAVPLLLRRNVVTGSTLAFRAEFRKLILPIPKGWVHDAWIAFLIGAAGKLVFASRPLIKYRQHSSNQIGALKRGLGVQLEAARAPHAEVYAAVAANFVVARERLLGASGIAIPTEVIRLLDAKIAHMNVRAAMPHSRMRRLPLVLRELAAGRYHCYSNSWKSFARDLWF
jgi:glycosyltransferase involved in cell wall biosynthesis